MAKQLPSGYYTLPGSLIREQPDNDVEMGEKELYNAYKAWQLSLSKDDELWYRYSPGPNKQITGFNKTYLPFIDNFYYVRKDPQINLRQQLYALETKRVPSSGNTELFNKQLGKVIVPDKWRPYHIDPCFEEWCKEPQPTQKAIPEKETNLTIFLRWIILGGFSLFISAIIFLAFK